MTDAFKAGHLKAQADLKEGKIDYPGPGYRAFYCDGYSTAVFEHRFKPSYNEDKLTESEPVGGDELMLAMGLGELDHHENYD